MGFPRLLSNMAALAELSSERVTGSRKPQRFIPYGALYGAPLQDDSIVVGRKDFTYAEPTTGKLADACLTNELCRMLE